MAWRPITDFDKFSFSLNGVTKDVYRRGRGPAVIVLAEIPGITPGVLDFARRVADLGCAAVVPHLFGVARADPISSAPRAALLVARTGAQVCISREFTVWATGRSSPIVSWLRGLAAAEHNRCGGPGVGAVGMCYTGGFALAMATDERLIAPVLSQPG